MKSSHALSSLHRCFAILLLGALPWAACDQTNSVGKIGATGGADAKIIISLVLLFGNGLLFIPIVLAGGVQGLIGLLSKKKTIPYTVAITLGTAAWLWLSAGR